VAPDEERPWWDRALDPLRYEASMFRVLLYVIAVAIGFVAALLLARAIF
jgi:hypothetical protein